MRSKQEAIRELRQIPGVGVALAEDLWHIGITALSDLVGQEPEQLYELTNRYEGSRQDRCVLYVYRCAVYFASTPADQYEPDKLKWWNWKDTVVS